jgi:glutathione S-transferase
MKIKTLLATLLMLNAFSLDLTQAASVQEPKQADMSQVQKVEKKRTLFGVAISPFVRKIRVILHEKNIPYELVEILPTKLLKATHKEIPANFAQASPLGKIPAYQEGEFSIADSAVIADYLEKTYAHQALIPTDSKQRAKVLFMEKYGDEVLAGVIHNKIFVERVVKPKVLNQTSDEKLVRTALTEELPVMLDYLESQLGNNQWMVGNTFTIADIAIVTHFISLELSGEKIDAEKWPKLAAYIQRVVERDSFKKSM